MNSGLDMRKLVLLSVLLATSCSALGVDEIWDACLNSMKNVPNYEMCMKYFPLHFADFYDDCVIHVMNTDEISDTNIFKDKFEAICDVTNMTEGWDIIRLSFGFINRSSPSNFEVCRLFVAISISMFIVGFAIQLLINI